MRKFLIAAVLPLFAQDPFQVAPKAYRLELENPYVRVVRVHFEPHEKIALHWHPQLPTVYLYLQNAGPVRFSHRGSDVSENFNLERPPVQAGGIRLARAVREVHEVENLSDQPSDYVRVELKTEIKDYNNFHGKKPPEPAKSGSKVRFENGQIRVVQIDCEPHKVCEQPAHAEPAVLVTMTPAHIEYQSQKLDLLAGQARFEQTDASAKLKNEGDQPIQLMRVDFKTAPAQ